MSRTLIALDNEQKEVLSFWLHYLMIKSELRAMQKKPNAPEEMKILKSIQEQLLYPKPITIFMDAGNTIATPELIYIDDDKIFINCDQ